MRGVPKAFRGVGVVLACWTGGRAFFLTLPVATGQDDLPETPPLPRAVLEAGEFTGADRLPVAAVVGQEITQIERFEEERETKTHERTRIHPAFSNEPSTTLAVAMPVATSPAGSQEIAYENAKPSIFPGAKTSTLRWSASSWTLVRGGGPSTGALAPGGQLGGSQAGARATFRAVELAQGVVAGPTARVSFALNGPAQREIAAGISVRVNGAVPVEIIAERRLGLSHGVKDRFALLAATGVDDVPLPAGLRASGYVQAGVAGFKQRDGFVDGAARVERAVQRIALGEVRIGANMWGAAQPGASRLDAGPSLSVKTDVLGQPMRISVEYRQRLAGGAAPKSGPALTIGADF